MLISHTYIIWTFVSRRFSEYADGNSNNNNNNNNQQRSWGYPDRGYGHQQPGTPNNDGYYFNTRLRGGVGVGGVGGNFYGNRPDGGDPSLYHSTPFPQPGILASWRSDLQGRQRPDSINLQNDRDVYVTTPFGQIQGFKVKYVSIAAWIFLCRHLDFHSLKIK